MEKACKGMRLAEFSHLVERCKICEMAEAIGDPNPLYRDQEAAKVEGYPDVIASPTFSTSMNLWGGPGFQELMEKLGANPLKVLHAEQEYEYFRPIQPGDMLHATIEVVDFYEKEGRSGKMAFAVLETSYLNSDGEKVVAGRSTIMERP